MQVQVDICCGSTVFRSYTLRNAYSLRRRLAKYLRVVRTGCSVVVHLRSDAGRLVSLDLADINGRLDLYYLVADMRKPLNRITPSQRRNLPSVSATHRMLKLGIDYWQWTQLELPTGVMVDRYFA